MLGAAGFIIPEAFNKYGANCGPEAVWFKVCKLYSNCHYFKFNNTLFFMTKQMEFNRPYKYYCMTLSVSLLCAK